MEALKTILAKSNGETLEQHTQTVAQCARRLAEGFNLKPDLAYLGGVLHDLGKAHPTFQKRLIGSDLNPKTFRHEIASLAFLSWFEPEYWSLLVEMVVAHHKSIDEEKKGLAWLSDNYRNWKVDHLGDEPTFNSWTPLATEVAQKLGIVTQPITYKQAYKNLEWAEEYCLSIIEEYKKGYSNWRGMLMASDHMASAIGDKVVGQLPKLFAVPQVSVFDRPSPKFPLSEIDASSTKPHTLVVAPTGAGKTDYLMRRTKRRVFYCLPFQASINAMTHRFRSIFPEGTDIRMLHSASRLADIDEDMQIDLQPFVGAAVKVLTPFQLAGILFGSAGYEAQLLDLKGNDIILDEVHTYSDISQAMVLNLVKLFADLKCRVHIGTATMPTELYNRLLEALGGSSQCQEIKLDEQQLATYDRHTVFCEEDETSALVKMAEYCTHNNEKVLLVANTVAQAQNWFEYITENYPEIKKMLIHSRFRRKDRTERERQLIDQFDRLPGPCMVVSTQVVEVSLDISFDRMVTQAAPIDSLIQRFGRVNRRRELQSGTKPVHILKPEGSVKPYNKEPVEITYQLLKEIEGQTLRQADLQSFIDRVFPIIDYRKIEAQVCWVNGETTKLLLTHNPKSAYLEMLDIDSVAFILNQDLEEYEQADFAHRQELEIPMSIRQKHAFGDMFQCLKGSRPYVLPPLPEYEVYGVRTSKNDTII